MKMRGGGTRGRPKLGAPHRRGDWDGGRQQSPGRGTCESAARGAAIALTAPWGRGPGDGVLLVVTVNLEDHRLRLDVLHEAPGDRRGDVLHVVEVEGGALAAVLQRLSRERLIVSVDKTKIHTSLIIQYSQNGLMTYLN